MKSLKSLILEIIKEPHIEPDEKWYVKFGDEHTETYYGPYSDYKSACLAGFLHTKPIDKQSPPRDKQLWDRNPAHFISNSTVQLSPGAIQYIKDNPDHKEMGDTIYKFASPNNLKPHPEWNKYRIDNPKFPEDWFEELWQTQSH